MEKQELLSIGDLNVWYTEGTPVLNHFSMDLFRNEVVGLIGLNGTGKTTLIKTVSGLLTSFEVRELHWCGKPFSFRDNSFRKSRYVVFAEDRSFSCFTFREYLAYAAKSYGREPENMDELAKGFHFEEYADVLMKELSTGNRKKAYLIAAFALHPELLLLDEPVNGLDFQSTEFLYRMINDYRSYGTVLFSSHILRGISCLHTFHVYVYKVLGIIA